MKKKIYIFLVSVFVVMLSVVVSYAADNAVTDSESVSDKQVPAKKSTPGQALKGSEPVKGIIIGDPITEEEMLLNPAKKKKKVKKQEETKNK